MSFRFKTIIGITVINGFFLVILLLNEMSLVTAAFSMEQDRQRNAVAVHLTNTLAIFDQANAETKLPELLDDFRRTQGLSLVKVTNADGIVIAQSPDSEELLSEPHTALQIKSWQQKDGRLGELVYEFERDTAKHLSAEVNSRLMWMSLFLLVALAASAWLLGNYLTDKLKQLQQDIAAANTGENLDTAITIDNDEIGSTIRAFRALNDNVKRSSEAKQAMLTKVLHLADENKRKENWLKTIINQLNEGIIAFDANGIIQYANMAASQFLEYDDRSLSGMSVFDLNLSSSQKKRIVRFIEKIPEQRTRESMTQHRNEVLKTQKGNAVAASLTLHFTRVQEQDFFILTLSEVSWQKQIEQQMIQSDAIRAGMLESSLSAVIAIDHDDRILEFNQSAEAMFGFLRDDVLGQKMSELIMPERFREAHRMGMKKYLASGEGPALRKRIQLAAINHENREFPIEIVITPILTEEGDIFTAVIDDISKRLEDTERLEMARQSADRANLEKSRFLASMSHEIRTPLNVVLGMTYLMQGTPLTDQQRHFMVSSENAGRNLLDMINDILDLSKIEAGKMEPTFTSFDPSKVFEDTVVMFKHRCWSKGLRLYSYIDDQIPSSIRADSSFYRQIITNLISNAVNYTDVGAVTCRLYTGRIHGMMHLLIDIEDTGTGMTEAEQKKVFDEFAQVHQSIPKLDKGTGLGLVISRQLANLIGADVTFTSRPNLGSTFTLQVPLIVYTIPDAKRPLANQAVGIASVDKHWLSLYEQQLTHWGATVRQIREPDGVHSIDLLLVDAKAITIATLSKLKSVAESLQTPLISIVEEGTSLHPMLSNSYAILEQPCPRAKLLLAIQGGISGQQWQDGTTVKLSQLPEPTLDTAQQDKGNILLVDDSETNRIIATTYLTDAGYNVACAEDGEKALAAVSRLQFDLILMDMRMPNMGGVDATRHIREQKLAESTPIVALTAHALVEVRDECLSVGMQDFLTKPIERNVLLATVAKWVLSDTSNERAEADDQSNIAPVFEKETLVFRKQTIDQLIADTNRLAVERMLKVFFVECERRLELIDTAWQNHDLDALAVSVHALKSSAKTFGAEQLSDTAARAESASEAKNIVLVEVCIKQLPTLMNEALAAITADFPEIDLPRQNQRG